MEGKHRRPLKREAETSHWPSVPIEMPTVSTHYSKRVGHGVPGVVVCSYLYHRHTWAAWVG